MYRAAPDQLEYPSIVVTEGDPAIERLESYCGRRYSFVVYVVVSRNEPLSQADSMGALVEYVLGAIDSVGGIPYVWRTVGGVTSDERSLSRAITVELETEQPEPTPS